MSLNKPSAMAPLQLAASQPALLGVHHTARPTWKLEETVHFYKEVMGLELVHAISARGWGPADHPDFLHFFFSSGQGSTIAFFYYLQTPKPEENSTVSQWLHNSVHTAWRVETEAELEAWRERLEAHGCDVLRVKHELIDSIYLTDPNGYLVEIAWQTRRMSDMDSIDARLTLEAAAEIERENGRRCENIDEIWQRKAELVRRYLLEDN